MQALKQLLKLPSLAAWDVALKADFRNVSLAFYGMTDDELVESEMSMVDLFTDMLTTPAGKTCTPEALLVVPRVHAIMLLFAALFERIGYFAGIHAIVRRLPTTPERQLMEAVLLYREVFDSRQDYLERVACLVPLIKSASVANPDMAYDVAKSFFLEGLKALSMPRLIGTARMFSRSFAKAFKVCGSHPELLAFVHEVGETWSEKNAIRLKQVRARVVDSIYIAALRIAEYVDEVPLEEPGEDDVGVTTELPSELETFLFDDMGARYQQQGKAASVCLEWNAAIIPVYMGTFFPRSFVESRNVFNDLFANPAFRKRLSQNLPFRVLDIGAGSGGNALGLLYALNAHGFRACVELTCVDGNPNMLPVLRRIIAWAQERLALTIKFTLHEQDMGATLTDFASALTRLGTSVNSPYDIVMSWKCLSEFYNRGYVQSVGVIERMLAFADANLSDSGLCVLADITTKDNQVEFFSSTMQREIGTYLARHAGLKRVLPRPCALWGHGCRTFGRCFTQKVFTVSHRKRRNDVSKITLSALTRMAFADQIGVSCSDAAAYRISPFSGGVCRGPGAAAGGASCNIKDGFRLGE